MTREEELPLVIAAKAGNEQAAEKLLIQYMKMIKAYCRKYKTFGILEREDLEQECVFFFYMALRKFDTTKDNKFGTYFYTQLQQLNRVIVYDDFVVSRRADYVSRVRKDPTTALKSVSIDAKRNEDGETYADCLVDSNSTPEDRLRDAQNTGLLRAEISKIFTKHYDDLEQKYLIHHFEMYEIFGITGPSEDPEFDFSDSRKIYLRRTFTEKLKYSKLSRDMLS